MIKDRLFGRCNGYTLIIDGACKQGGGRMVCRYFIYIVVNGSSYVSHR